jgi:arylsulfatase A-like enzyme
MLLKEAGYRTCMVGKWGLVGRPGHPGSPNRKGFDHFFGFDNQGFAHFYYPEFLWRNGEKVLFPKNHDLRVNGEYRKGAGDYSHDELVKEALSWVRRNREHSFFLYIPFCIPHAELVVPEDSIAPYREFGWPEKPRIEGVGNTGGGKDAGYGSQYTRGYCGQSHPHAAYAGMISRMDRSVGMILDLLEELHLTRDTFVLFSSDNGPSDEGGQTLRFFKSSGPLSGHKRSMHEGGLRVPTIARWPGRIEPGSMSDHPSAFWDFLPTACEVAGIAAPGKIDGISYLPELLGRTEDQRKHEYLYWPWAIRVGKWKLHPRGKDRYALFDLENDIGEKHDVAAQHPELVSRYGRYFQEAKQPLK